MMKLSHERLGNNAREAREKAGFTLEDAAQKADFAPEFLKRVEAGTRILSLVNMCKLCHLYDTTPSAILDGVLVDVDEK